MPSADILKTVAIDRTPRVMQLEGMFDLPASKVSEQKWTVDLALPDDWNIGVIVGPSGSGKTTVAKELFGKHLVQGLKWPAHKSIVDAFPADAGIKDITTILSSVGFSSPPSWLRPYHALSNGEQFRVTIARALAEQKDLVVIDEFTSVVDRTVAKIGSAAIQKTVRRREQKFIAVSCHFDILEWLEPDWVYEPARNKLTVGRLLRRPQIKLEICRVHHSAWTLFEKHHYLTREMNKAAYCFCAFWMGIPVAFDAWLPFFGQLGSGAPIRRGHRTVCLPDYQGVGIGGALFTTIASMWKGLGFRPFSNTAHPAEIANRVRSANWSLRRAPSRTAKDKRTAARATNRMTASFEYVGPAMNEKEAKQLLAC
jgi:ABC-type molybdenum transport system ATPase subunit/photorepair protein PhrA/GNAT superfamily N-acetyltransferase